MKTKSNLWKVATLLLAFTCISLITLTSFKNNSAGLSLPAKSPGGEDNRPIIADQTEARLLYNNFLTAYPDANFSDRGGFISRSTLKSLFDNLNTSTDTLIYYYLGRTNNSENCIMLFNDPRYHDLNTTLKFRTISPYCPPTCNIQLNNYLTGQ